MRAWEATCACQRLLALGARRKLQRTGSVQVLQELRPHLLDAVLKQVPATLLRLLALLPRPLHPAAIAAHTRAPPASVAPLVTLCTDKDLPCSAMPPALAAFTPHAMRLQALTQLTCRNLRAGECARDAALEVARILPALPALQRFDISGSRLGASGGKIIIVACGAAAQLQHLALAGNCLGNDGLAAFLQWPDGPHGALTHLDISDNGFDENVHETISAALLGMPALQELRVGGLDVSDARQASLAFSGDDKYVPLDLQHCSALQALELPPGDAIGAGNDEVPNGRTGFTEHFHGAEPALTSLSIKGGRDTELQGSASAGAAVRLPAAARFAALQRLRLECPLAAAQEMHSSMLGALTMLEVCDFEGWQHVYQLCSALKRMPQLRHLRLYSLHAGEQGRMPRAAAIECLQAAGCGIAGMTGLSHLAFCTALRDDGGHRAFDRFLSALTALNGLSELVLSMQAAPALPHAYANAWPALTRLHLHHPAEGDHTRQRLPEQDATSGAALRTWCAAAPALRSLALDSVLLQSDEDARAWHSLPLYELAVWLAPRKLHLDMEHGTQQRGAAVLAQQITWLRGSAAQLRGVELRLHGMSGADLSQLAAAVPCLTALTHLALNTGHRDEQAAAMQLWAQKLAAGLPRLAQLRSLCLGGYPMVEKEDAVFTKAENVAVTLIARLTRLQALHVCVDTEACRDVCPMAHSAGQMLRALMGGPCMRQLTLELVDMPAARGEERLTKADVATTQQCVQLLAEEMGVDLSFLDSHGWQALLQ